MGKSLFNIEQEYLDIINEVEECEGELTPELAEKLSINEKELETKVKAYHHIITQYEGEINTCNEECERLNAIAKSKQSTIEKLKERLLEATFLFGYNGKTGNKKLDYDTVKLYTVDSKSVSILDEESFNNPKFTRFVLKCKLKEDDLATIAETIGISLSEETDYNKVILRKELGDYLKSGEVVEGATIITKPYLRIK